MTLQLNGFELVPSGTHLSAYSEAMPDSSQLRDLRQALGDGWITFWSDGVVYGLPVLEDAAPFGAPVHLACEDNLHLVVHCINALLPRHLPQYPGFRRRPFSFQARRTEIFSSILQKIGCDSSLAELFEIRPTYSLEARIIDFRVDQPRLGVFAGVRTRWRIPASLEMLAESGVDLRGLYVVRRNPLPGERRLVGRVASLDGGSIRLAESVTEEDSAPITDVELEASRVSYTRCLKVLLGKKYDSFVQQLVKEQDGLLNAKAVNEAVETMGELLKRRGPLRLAEDLEYGLGPRLQITNDDEYQAAVVAGEVEYCFDPARTKRERYPWKGLESYGPFSGDTFAKKSPTLLVVFPETDQGVVEQFLRALKDGIAGSVFSTGMGRVFGLVNIKFDLLKVPLANSTSVATHYRRCLEDAFTNRSAPWDAAIVVIRDEHGDLPDKINPYLQSKAFLLMAGVPSQQVHLSTIRPGRSLAYSLQNMSLALYAKMSGVPWTVNQDATIADEIVVGIGTCELSGSRVESRQRFVGVTTVFRGDGNYLLGNLSKECGFSEYPSVLRESTASVLEEIRQRNGWAPGDSVRVVFHSPVPLRDVDAGQIIGDAVAVVGAEQNIEFAFLTVTQDHPFLLVDPEAGGVTGRSGGAAKGVMVPDRGTIAQVGKYSRLLCTTGPRLLKRTSPPLPRPLHVRLHQASTFRGMEYLTEQVLKFTSLSWRSTLPAQRPVTIYYSELIAWLLARMRSVDDWSPAMLNTKLRSSRWFL